MHSVLRASPSKRRRPNRRALMIGPHRRAFMIKIRGSSPRGASPRTVPTLIRNTRQRTVIRDVLDRASRPLGAPEILAEAQMQASGIGIATVYRTVKALIEEGWLVAVELPGEPPRYERAGKEHHHHFLCKECGKLFELNGCVDNLKRLLPDGFRILGHDVLLYGACADCGAATA